MLREAESYNAFSYSVEDIEIKMCEAITNLNKRSSLRAVTTGFRHS